ncbi:MULTISPECIES: hypothetical protein [Kocuria]|jgi:hypothetical protein|uniref:hypothetical protein n=1 Tax=Kocuria TaxID=57493 RepID=UPI00203E2764|nr:MULTISPECIES: hypothetical protein [Kocuria]MCM3686726.1 hypothetical protein [Kocuria rosea]HST73598.1 hypothetical protein [Kocuria rosea]
MGLAGRLSWTMLLVAGLLVAGTLSVAVTWLNVSQGRWGAHSWAVLGDVWKVAAAFIPAAVVLVAFQVYRADQWWKRVEWALDAAADDEHPVRQLAGLKVLNELKKPGSWRPPPQDSAMFQAVGAAIEKHVRAQWGRADDTGDGPE